MVQIGNDWDELLKDEWEKPYYRELRSFLLDEYENETVYPPAADIFTALRLTPYSNVKVVILGQDPYHEPGQAVGLAFSVPGGTKLPPSLVNILKELASDAGASAGISTTANTGTNAGAAGDDADVGYEAAPGGTPSGDIGNAAVDDAYFRNLDKNMGKANNFQDSGTEDAEILEKKTKKAELFQDYGIRGTKNLENNAMEAEFCQDFGTEDAKNLEKKATEAGFCQDFGTGDGKNLENKAGKTGNCQDSGPGDEKKLEKGGVLAPWAEQGVLLLNTVLTVRAHRAASLKGRGWEQFTDRIIELLAARKTPMVFVLWGAHAISKRELILRAEAEGQKNLLSEEDADGDQGGYPHGNAAYQSRRHLIITAPHPSPLSAHRGFFGGRYFSRCNYFLSDNGLEPIDWSLNK